MNYAAMISTAIFVICVRTFFYIKVRIVNKHEGVGSFAAFGYMNQTYVDWESRNISDAFISEWNSKINKVSLSAPFRVRSIHICL